MPGVRIGTLGHNYRQHSHCRWRVHWPQIIAAHLLRPHTHTLTRKTIAPAHICVHMVCVCVRVLEWWRHHHHRRRRRRRRRGRATTTTTVTAHRKTETHHRNFPNYKFAGQVRMRRNAPGSVLTCIAYTRVHAGTHAHTSAHSIELCTRARASRYCRRRRRGAGCTAIVLDKCQLSQ